MVVFKKAAFRAVALRVLAPAVICLAPLSAQAASYTFNGQVPAGTDALGRAYTIGPFGGGLVNFSEVAGGQPDPTQQVLFTASNGLADATSFTLTETGTLDSILSLDAGFGNAFETYASNSNILSDWTASENAAGTQITYSAPIGDALLSGERFDTFTTFTMADTLPSGFTYNITWTGDPAISAAPEPSIWALMIIGIAFVGGALRMIRARGRLSPLHRV